MGKLEKIRGRLGVIGSHILSAVVAFALTPVLLTLSGRFDAVMGAYDAVLLLASFVSLVTIGTVDFFRSSAKRENILVLLYLTVIVAFFILSYFLGAAEKSSGIPIVITLTLAISARLAVGLDQAFSQEGDAEPQVGFASAGVLLVKERSRSSRFVLVHNKNLRQGLGLWVPPGGHVDPALERPDVRLCSKITEETGYLCEVINFARSLMPEDQSRWESRACVWLIPPAFLLREDLMGLCSHGHAVHIDLCYICRSSGEIRNSNPKYHGTSLLEVDAKLCVESYFSAQTAITTAIDELHRRNSGLAQGVHDDLTQDIIWRLHLAARHLEQIGELENGQE